MTTAEDFDSSADVERTLVVILLYGILWTSGLFGIGFFVLRQYWIKRHRDEVHLSWKKIQEKAVNTRSKKDIQAYLNSYANAFFPGVFQVKPVFIRVWDEIFKHHRYVSLFLAQDDLESNSRRIMTVIQLLTTQSMLVTPPVNTNARSLSSPLLYYTLDVHSCGML
jgi:hypothetical protein